MERATVANYSCETIEKVFVNDLTDLYVTQYLDTLRAPLFFSNKVFQVKNTIIENYAKTLAFRLFLCSKN